MTQYEQIESKIIKVFLQILLSFDAVLNNVGITYSKPKIQILKSDFDEYESEFCIWFYKNDDVIDVLENHIFRGGKRVAKLEEFETWFKETISVLIEENNNGVSP